MTNPVLPIPNKVPDGWPGARVGWQAFWQGMRLVRPGGRLFSLVLMPVIASGILIVAFIIGAFILGQGLLVDWIQSLGWEGWIEWLGTIAAFLTACMLGYFLFTPTMSLFRPLFLDRIAERVYLQYTGRPIHNGKPGNLLTRQLSAIFDVFKGIVVGLIIQMPLGILALVTGAGALLTIPVHAYIEGRDLMDVPVALRKPGKQVCADWNKHYRWSSAGLGAGAAGALLIPLVNLFVVPAGVAGATILMIGWERQDANSSEPESETSPTQ